MDVRAVLVTGATGGVGQELTPPSPGRGIRLMAVVRAAERSSSAADFRPAAGDAGRDGLWHSLIAHLMGVSGCESDSIGHRLPGPT